VSSGNLADETLVERIERDMEKVLQEHQAEKRDDDILRQIRSIQARFKTNHPMVK